jgi:hypothetical protein
MDTVSSSSGFFVGSISPSFIAVLLDNGKNAVHA